MAIARERVAPQPVPQRTPTEMKPLNAQQVTAVALNFLKSLGHKRGVNPRRVFIENQRYVVEAEIGKRTLAKVQVDMITSEIKEYGIEKEAEETPINLPVEPRAIVIVVAISVVVSLVFALLDLQSLLAGLL